jgi:hypothetical protein
VSRLRAKAESGFERLHFEHVFFVTGIETTIRVSSAVKLVESVGIAPTASGL